MKQSYTKSVLASIARVFRLAILAGACLASAAMAADPGALVNQMLRDGFDPGKANLLLGQWTDAKHIMVEFAKSGDQAKIDLAHRLVDYKFTAWEQNWTSTVDELVRKGISRPIEGMGPTGGWKAPLGYRDTDRIRFIIDGANADIDATFFGRNPGVTEEFVERAAVNWAARASGTSVTLPDGTPDYAKVNEILKASEVTPFPRNPDGTMSSGFKQKFPEIVHESYPGAYGQRSLEVDYMITDKGKADIVRYDKSGNLVKQGGRVQLTRDQAAETLIEDLSNARYTRLDRMNRLAADYNEKYLGHLGQGANQDAETTAKMLQRMIEGDSRLRGFTPAGHPLYDKAKAVKQALREGDDNLLKAALGGQNLDDFLQQAQGEMRRINIRNQTRLSEMLDDTLGTPSATRMNTALRALTLLGYGATTADAVLKAKSGEEAKEASKALASMVAADLAGSAVGSAIGGAAGFASGVGTAMVVGLIVHGSLEWTEEGIDNMLGGYKVDAAMRGIFLNKDNMDRFLGMSPQEIKAIIDREWDVQHQWGGAYQGKFGDREEQLKRKREIFEQAMQMQSLMNKNKLRAQVLAEIVNDELRKLVEKKERGELTDEELAEARDKFRNDAGGLWAAIFGTDLEAMINERLATDYSRYGSLFEEFDEEPGLPGLWDALFGDAEEREAARHRVDENYGQLMEDKSSLLASLAYVDRLMQQIREAFLNGKDVSDLYNELAEEMEAINASLSLLEGLAQSVLADLNASYGKEEDLTRFYELRSAIAAMLAELNQSVDDRGIQVANLKAELDKLKRAVAQEALAGLQGEVNALEETCAQIATQAGLAQESAREAGRIQQLYVDALSSGMEAESGVSDALAACATSAELQASAAEAARTAMGAAKAARAGYDGALSLLDRCADPDAVAAADTMFDGARTRAREAAVAYTRAVEGSDLLDQIAAGAKQAKAGLEGMEQAVQQAWTYRETYSVHLDNARHSEQKIAGYVDNCRQSRSDLLQKFDGLMQTYPWLTEDTLAVSTKGRIDSQSSEIAKGEAATPVSESEMDNQALKAAEARLSDMRNRLDACEKADAPLLKLLESGEAMLALEGFSQWQANIGDRKNGCLARLDKQGQVAEGACEGENWYPGCDPNVRGGSTATSTQLTRAQQAADDFQRPPGGDRAGDAGAEGDRDAASTTAVPLPPGYTQDATAETPPSGEQQPQEGEDEERGAADEQKADTDTIAEEFGTPTLPARPAQQAPAASPAPAAPATPAPLPGQGTAAAADSCQSRGSGCRTAADGKSCICPEAVKPVPAVGGTRQAPPVRPPSERYGVFLLFDAKNAIWVGAESGLKNRASGSVTYGGMCRDVEKCPLVYSMKKGPFDSEKQAAAAYCQDVESGPWYSLGVTRVKMKWQEQSYATSKVPACD